MATQKKFEAGLQDLKVIVSKLEEEELSLDQSLALFEKGVTLSKTLSKKIEDAEKRLEKIKQQLGED